MYVLQLYVMNLVKMEEDALMLTLVLAQLVTLVISVKHVSILSGFSMCMHRFPCALMACMQTLISNCSCVSASLSKWWSVCSPRTM